MKEKNYQKILVKPIRIMPIMNPQTLDTEANVFVKNIDPLVTQTQLEDLFTQAGDVIVIDLRTNEHGQSLGYGCVQFRTKEQANYCIQTLNGKKLGERIIEIEMFKKNFQRSKTK